VLLIPQSLVPSYFSNILVLISFFLVSGSSLAQEIQNSESDIKKINFYISNEENNYECIEYLKRTLSQKGYNNWIKSHIYHLLGNQYYKSGLNDALIYFDSAIFYYQKSVELRLNRKLEKDTINYLLCNLYINLTSCEKYRNRDYKSLNWALNASHTLKKLYGTQFFNLNKTIVNLNLARAYYHIGDYDNAAIYFESIYQSYLANRAKGNLYFEEVAIREYSAMLARLANNPKRSLELLQSISLENMNRVSKAFYLNYKGTSFFFYGLYDSSYYYYSKSHDLFESLQYTRGLIQVELSISNTLIKLKKYNKAIIKLNNILANYPSIDILTKAKVYTNLGDALLLTEKYDESLDYYRLASKLLLTDERNISLISNKDELLSILNSKGYCLYKKYLMSQEKVTIDELSSLLNTTTLLIDEIRQDYIADISNLVLSEKVKPIYEQNLSCHFEFHTAYKHDSILANAFQQFEKSRSITLLDAIRKSNVQNRFQNKLLRNEKEINLKINYYEKQYTLEQDNEASALAVNFLDSIILYKSIRKQILDTLKERIPDYHRAVFNQEVANINEIRSSLDSDETLIEYFVGDSAFFTLAITRDTTLFIKQEHPDSLLYWARTYQENLTLLDACFIRPAHELYNLLLEPLEQANLLHKKLTIVPDDLLASLSFDALVTMLPQSDRVYFPDFSSSYIASKHRINYAFSATTLLENNTKVYKNEGEFLGVAPLFQSGVSINDTYFDKLSWNQAEVERLGKLFSDKQVLEQDATIESFGKEASRYRLIHFATHAKANNENGDLSYIVFGNSGQELLYAKDLYAMDLNADLVVLSACQTALGSVNRGEGIISLARGFTYAGASAVITSLWNVREKTNHDIMIRFYEGLKDGLAKDEALHQAKLAYLESIGLENQQLAHPYFWAPLISIGDPSPVEEEAFLKRWMVWGLALLILLAAGLAYRNRIYPLLRKS